MTVTNQSELCSRDRKAKDPRTFTKTEECSEQRGFEVAVLEQRDFGVAILQVQEVNESMQLVLNRVFGITL